MNPRHTLPVDPAAQQGSHRHYLFILPETVSEFEYQLILQYACTLVETSPVYIVIKNQPVWVDEHGLCFMPLHAEHLPSSNGAMTVFVLHDTALAQAALTAYEDADVLLLNPRVGGTLASRNGLSLWAAFSAHTPAMISEEETVLLAS